MSKFARRSSVYRAATSVSGHRHPFSHSTTISAITTPASTVAAPGRACHARTGIATMQPANTAHTAVCSNFTILNLRLASFDILHALLATPLPLQIERGRANLPRRSI
jgi:hypothetical protein